MKTIGMTNGGSVLIEINQSEVRALESFAVKLAAEMLPLLTPATTPATEPVANKARTKRIKSEKTALAPAKAGKVCVICGKHVGPRKKTCSKACRLAQARALANAAYAKKHPGAKPRSDRKEAPTPQPSRSPDRLDLIRQANDRVNKLRDEEAG